LQTLQVLLSGAAERFGFTDAELAIMCASHYGEPFHVAVVESILRKIGLDGSFLRCGTAVSLSLDYALEYARQGLELTPFLSDCSGKHAGMLAVCVHRGWDLAGYVAPEHPLQRENLRILAELAEVPESTISIGVDGCSVPVFAMPLRNMALAYARLARPGLLQDPLRAACGRIFQAMVAHPEMIAGTDGWCSELIRGAHGKLVGKLGAEGCYGVGVKEEGLGLALKFEDGGIRGIPAVILSVLRELGVLSPEELRHFEAWRHKAVKNDVGWTVGEIRPAFRLERG
jgi:L-asparaginase II